MFKEYLRTNVAQMRPVTEQELNRGLKLLNHKKISVSQEDIDNGSPKIGDMVARNPENHQDKWLVAKEYFQNNFIPMV